MKTRLETIKSKLQRHDDICYRDIIKLNEQTIVDCENAMDDIEWLICCAEQLESLKMNLEQIIYSHRQSD